MRCDVRHDLRVEFTLPVHPLGDRLDHEVAVRESCKVAVVVGRVDLGEPARSGQRRGFEPGKTGERLRDDAVRVAFLRRQVEQDNRDARVDQVRGDLRPHHAGAENRNLADGKDDDGHGVALLG